MSATNQNGNVMPATTQNGNRFCCQSSGSLNILFVCGLTFFSHSDSLTSDPLSTQTLKTVQSVFNSFCSFSDIRNKKPKSKLINSRVVAEPYSELYQISKMEYCENIRLKISKIRLKTVIYFCKTPYYFRCLLGSEYTYGQYQCNAKIKVLLGFRMS